MTIHLKRLDFSSTISAMICVCARHAVTADGATQQALDEIAASLNNVAAIVGRRRLAPILDGPIPPVPVPHQVGEDEEEDDEGLSLDDSEPEALATRPERRRAPRTIFPDLVAGSNLSPSQTVVSKLSPSQTATLEYIRANPGCTLEEISKATGRGIGTILTGISVIRKSIPIHSPGSGNQGGYRVDG